MQEATIEEAKRRYPIGTVFYALNTRTKCIITTGLFKNTGGDTLNEFAKMEESRSIQTDSAFHCVHSQGKWAEIISLPEVTNLYQIY